MGVDLSHPIGSIYPQYPKQLDPNTLFKFTTWEVINYGGAFFRADGGNASAFIEEGGTLIAQEESIKSHNHTMNHGHSINDPGHSHTVYTRMPYGDYNSTDNNNCGNPAATGWTSSNTTGITVNDYNGNTGDTGGTETRPVNYTYKIWKRVG